MTLDGQDDSLPPPAFEDGNNLLDTERQIQETNSYKLDTRNIDARGIAIANPQIIQTIPVAGDFHISLPNDLSARVAEPQSVTQSIEGGANIVRLGYEYKTIIKNAMNYINWRSLIRQRITIKIRNEDLVNIGDIVLVNIELNTPASKLFPTNNKIGIVDGIIYGQDTSTLTILV